MLLCCCTYCDTLDSVCRWQRTCLTSCRSLWWSAKKSQEHFVDQNQSNAWIRHIRILGGHQTEKIKNELGVLWPVKHWTGYKCLKWTVQIGFLLRHVTSLWHQVALFHQNTDWQGVIQTWCSTCSLEAPPFMRPQMICSTLSGSLMWTVVFSNWGIWKERKRRREVITGRCLNIPLM